MKTKIIILLTLLITSTSLFSQGHNSLTGTWEWTNNNQRFVLNIWDSGKTIDGHFTMYQTDGSGNETILYTSDRPVNPADPNSINYPPALTGGAYNQAKTGYYQFWFTDTIGLPNEEAYDAYLYLRIIYPDLNSNDPLQLEWNIKPVPKFGPSSMDDYNVPINITLAKI